MYLLAPLLAQASAGDWHPTTLVQALLSTAVFSLAGTALAIVGYKIFDLCTPGDLHEEIIKNRNVAAAVLGASIILGVCIVVAAAIISVVVDDVVADVVDVVVGPIGGHNSLAKPVLDDS